MLNKTYYEYFYILKYNIKFLNVIESFINLQKISQILFYFPLYYRIFCFKNMLKKFHKYFYIHTNIASRTVNLIHYTIFKNSFEMSIL